MAPGPRPFRPPMKANAMAARFSHKTADDILAATGALGIALPMSGTADALRRPLDIGGRQVRNRIAIQPMEGCDGTPDGRPGALTARRYRRFARGGAGLLWMEAAAVVPEGRANPRQLCLTPGTLDAFARLVAGIKAEGVRRNGFEPVLICQLTHSGRYSRPRGAPEPWIVCHNALFEKGAPLDDSRVVSDDSLRALEEQFGRAAHLAERAGFDGADIKGCHGYLVGESLSAFERRGPYGGSFENRTRLLRNALQQAQACTGQAFLVTSRLTLYDGFPHPHGIGVRRDGSLEPDFSEPLKLAGLLHRRLGIPLLNLTMGNPYVNPHVNRPFDRGAYAPPEPPLRGVARLMAGAKAVKQAFPTLAVISSGHSYLRQFAPLLVAGAVEAGLSDIAGFGRMAFAYPGFPNDVLHGAGFDAARTCVTCGRCTELMRAGAAVGCVLHDRRVYGPLYRKACRS